MIHLLLPLTRPLIITDTETTGVDHKNDRIVELGFQLWTAEGLQKEWRSLINPGIPIPPRVTEVHGITDAMINACRVCGTNHPITGSPLDLVRECDVFKPVPRFRDLATNLAHGFRNCDYAGKNVRFDLQILSAEFSRANTPWSYAGARIIDIDRLEQIAQPRTLAALHERYTGHPHDGAHGALSDVRASATVIVKQLEAHTMLPRDLNELHELQWPGFIDCEGKFRFVDGVPCFGRWGKHAGRPMNDPEVNKTDRRGQSYWDFILTSDFSAEVKKIAADAKMGKYPEAKQ